METGLEMERRREITVDGSRVVAVESGEGEPRLLPRGRIVRIAGGDHYIMEERPAEVLAGLEALLAES